MSWADFFSAVGATSSVVVPASLAIASSLRRSREERQRQHAEGQEATAELKSEIHSVKADLGQRLTAVEVAIEYIAPKHSPRWGQESK